MANTELTALEAEDFVMTSEINWNLQGWRWSKKMMKERSCWEEWFQMRKRDEVKKTIADNNEGGQFDAYKAEYQAGRGNKWLANFKSQSPS